MERFGFPSQDMGKDKGDGRGKTLVGKSCPVIDTDVWHIMQ